MNSEYLEELDRQHSLEEGMKRRAEIMDRRHDAEHYWRLERALARGEGIFCAMYHLRLLVGRLRYQGGERPDPRYEWVEELYRRKQRIDAWAKRWHRALKSGE